MAGKIVLGGPYDSVEDVLSLDLSERQGAVRHNKTISLSHPSIALNEGDDRINDGQYR